MFESACGVIDPLNSEFNDDADEYFSHSEFSLKCIWTESASFYINHTSNYINETIETIELIGISHFTLSNENPLKAHWLLARSSYAPDQRTDCLQLKTFHCNRVPKHDMIHLPTLFVFVHQLKFVNIGGKHTAHLEAVSSPSDGNTCMW